MVSMDDVFEIKAKTGGLSKTLGRLFSGEAMFVQKFRAKADGELLLSPQYLLRWMAQETTDLEDHLSLHLLMA